VSKLSLTVRCIIFVHILTVCERWVCSKDSVNHVDVFDG
jgi:hypothetical protein